MMVNDSGLAQRDIYLENMGESLERALYYRNNKEQAYSEGFQEFINKAIDVNINGINYKVHQNVNYYIDMTKSCTCNCEFCIAKVDFQRRYNCYENIPQCFLNSLEILKDANPSIQITGGEPTLFPNKLEELISIVKDNNCRNPVLNTNGYNLWRCSRRSTYSFKPP